MITEKTGLRALETIKEVVSIKINNLKETTFIKLVLRCHLIILRMKQEGHQVKGRIEDLLCRAVN